MGSSLASREPCHPTIPVHLAFECPQHPQLLTWGSATAPGSWVPAHGPPGPSSLCLSPVILSASLSLQRHLKARAFCRRHAGLRCAHLGHRLGFIYSDASPHLRVLSELLSLAPHPPGGNSHTVSQPETSPGQGTILFSLAFLSSESFTSIVS